MSKILGLSVFFSITNKLSKSVEALSFLNRMEKWHYYKRQLEHGMSA